MILCVRVHAENPWVMERLARMADYYLPCPPILVVDFGSAPEYAMPLARLCGEKGYTLVVEPDDDVFSLAAARNIGFQNTATNFVFFCDPDFFGERDLFQRLAETANALNMRSIVDIVLNLPAVHLPEAETWQFEQTDNPDMRTGLLRQWGWLRNYTDFSTQDESFTAPYSNVLMMNRAMFSKVGGYNASFRGHGSEDFEFLLRLSIYMSYLPMPSAHDLDLHGPTSGEFFKAKPYAGFRRLFELMAQPTESLGLKVFHLWHPRHKQSEWFRNRDRKRVRFGEAISKYIDTPLALLGVDYLSRPKRMLCLFRNEEVWRCFVPMRLAGYELVPAFVKDVDSVQDIVSGMLGHIDAVAIYKSGDRESVVWREVSDRARAQGKSVVMVEPGALPYSLRYGDDTGEPAPLFDQADFDSERFSEEEELRAYAYVHMLRQGFHGTGAEDPYETSSEKYCHLAQSSRLICFVPLRHSAEPEHPALARELPQLAQRYPGMIFMVLPANKRSVARWAAHDNLVVADPADNVHALLDLAHVTLSRSSDIALLSLLHEKPTIVLGNILPGIPEGCLQVASAEEGIEAFLDKKLAAPSIERVRRIAAWLLYRKYSFFTVSSNPSASGKSRRSDYTMRITEFRWNEHHHVLDRLGDVEPFSWRSYAASRIGVRGHSAGTMLKQVQRRMLNGRLSDKLTGVLRGMFATH